MKQILKLNESSPEPTIVPYLIKWIDDIFIYEKPQMVLDTIRISMTIGSAIYPADRSNDGIFKYGDKDPVIRITGDKGLVFIYVPDLENGRYKISSPFGQILNYSKSYTLEIVDESVGTVGNLHFSVNQDSMDFESVTGNISNSKLTFNSKNGNKFNRLSISSLGGFGDSILDFSFGGYRF